MGDGGARCQVSGDESPGTRHPAPGTREMFTGIVEAVGTVVEASAMERGGRLAVDAGGLDAGAPGDSVAVNGVCLTVERLSGARFPGGSRFQVTTMLETLR